MKARIGVDEQLMTELYPLEPYDRQMRCEDVEKVIAAWLRRKSVDISPETHASLLAGVHIVAAALAPRHTRAEQDAVINLLGKS